MNLGELLEVIDPYLKRGVNSCCLRGQAQHWPIRPKAYRPEFSGAGDSFVKLAESRLDQWKAEALPYLREIGVVPDSSWDWLVIAQHYGLATRLIDWTSNPLVAIFFAVLGHDSYDGELIIWNFTPEIYNPAGTPAEMKNVVLVRPAPTFPRLKFQQGLLSFHPTPEDAIREDQLIRITISQDKKVHLQNQLFRSGIHHESVFATLDHLAEKINWISANQVRGH